MSGLVIDLFAGGGGASLGMSLALGREPDIAINHDPVAIAIHKANHPDTVHYCQSVWAVEPIHVTGGRPVDILWASPDCKHFSKAKGGKPKCQNIRDLAWIVIKWAKGVRPTLIMLENVEEFTEWGPLGPDKRPIENLKGTTFRAWRRQLQNLGYHVQHRELRACDYGAPTIRKRLFLIARRDDLPIVWPEPTHGPGRAHPYRTAAECIDWDIPCPSIFERAKPLAENTLKRIARGIDRFVINSPRPFIVGVGGREGQSPPAGVDRPMRTMTAKADKALAVPFLAGSGGPAYGGKPQLADQPMGTLLAEHHQAVATCILKHYGGVVGGRPESPLGTVTGTDHHSVCTAHILRQFGQSVGAPADAPVGTVMPGGGGKTGVVTSHLLKLYGSCRHGQAATDPMPTATAGGNHLGEVRNLLIRFRPRPAGFFLDDWDGLCADAWAGEVVLDGVVCRIVDVGLRMFEPRELFRAQSFPDTYEIDPLVNGKPLAKKYQTKACGNSVPPVMSEALTRANWVEQPENMRFDLLDLPLLAAMEQARGMAG